MIFKFNMSKKMVLGVENVIIGMHRAHRVALGTGFEHLDTYRNEYGKVLTGFP
jgi:hypothetical protein